MSNKPIDLEAVRARVLALKDEVAQAKSRLDGQKGRREEGLRVLREEAGAEGPDKARKTLLALRKQLDVLRDKITSGYRKLEQDFDFEW